MANNKSALIAMSGGVDSSVAAKLMIDCGFRCEGTTMRLYRNEALGLSCYRTCCSQQDIEDAAEVAFQLDIPYEVSDFTEDFHRLIIDKFIRVYESGGTPNPCIDCNRYIKFDKLLQFAAQRGLYYIVTGHYARIEQDPVSGRYLLKKALDLTKDQSYVLYSMTQEQLSHTLMPLGTWKKDDVRKLAMRLGFVNARKHDSQDICFVPDGDYGTFMEQYTGQKYPQGNFIDVNGNVIGKHQGAVRYTIGQRKGLGLPMGEPVYVCGKDMLRNTVTVAPQAALYTRRLIAEDMNYISIEGLEAPLRLKARTRYHQSEQWVTVFPKNNKLISIEFDEPQRAVTPGQAVVLYNGDTVVGGGSIKEVQL
ncbi:MAG: tRNA 2-thiouridine(34) synthase MnmA [Clostridiaceae bacterium]|nr:tRNA 2-thiouridine(34) synthase MnmA [Clostridiaceae bacterium]